MIRRGSAQEKLLLLLLGGLTLSLTRSPRGYFKILKQIQKEWKDINQRKLAYSINALYSSQLIDQINNKDGTTTFVLNKNGKKVALSYSIENLVVSRHPWDKKWRIVIFDIPEKLKKVREAFRYHLKRLGFKELQHSVFVLPFKCLGEVEYLVEFYNARRFVRYIEAHHIDNELDLRRKFNVLTR